MKVTISGVRGIIGDDYTLSHTISFCKRFADIMPSNTCVMGRDTRPTGKMISDVASATLASAGVDVLDLGIMPTPSVFFESQKYGAGLIVTSSHNPIQWNGLKFILNGRGVNQTEINYIKSNADQKIRQNPYGDTRRFTSQYADAVCRIIKKINNAPSILIDAGGGAATNIAPQILKKLGCQTDAIPSKRIRTDPTSDSLDKLVTESAGYDAGVAFDTDGDRMVLVMNGAVQPPDATLGLGIAAAIKQEHKKFVISMDTSALIERYITDRGGKVWRAPVGEANVVNSMIRNDASVGGEGSSGGFILGEFNYCRDGILAAGLIASMIPGGFAQDALKEVTGTGIIREKVAGNADTIQNIIEKIKSISTQTDMTDGIRAIIDEDTWILIRPSNTEDIIRISAEAMTHNQCRNIIKRVKEIIKNAQRT